MIDCSFESVSEELLREEKVENEEVGRELANESSQWVMSRKQLRLCRWLFRRIRAAVS